MFHEKINDQLTLCILSGRDAPALFELTEQSRDYLQKWLPWVQETKSVEDSMQFIKASLLGYEQRKSLTAGIFYKHSLVGVTGFNTLDFTNYVGKIGYWLASDYQRKGIMTQATKAMITYGFEEFHLNRIEIHCATENKKSQAIPERLGFRKEGHLRQVELLHHGFVDHYVYALLKQDCSFISTELST